MEIDLWALIVQAMWDALARLSIAWQAALQQPWLFVVVPAIMLFALLRGSRKPYRRR